jgi:D-alanyl-D-alanine dipeptidase
MGETADMSRSRSSGCRRSLVLSCCLFFVAVTVAQQGSVQPVRDIREARTLVEVIRLDSTIQLDIRYATANNFMGRPMYIAPRAFLQRAAAEALVRVHHTLEKAGYGVLLFDGYRPWAVTKKFWDETPPEKRKFVANPAKGSKHNRGCAVDLTLYDRKTGREVEMPSPYDDFSDRAASDFEGGTPEQRRTRMLLRNAMLAEGFTVEPSEWWHFDHRDWAEYPVLDVSFELLSTLSR